ncbi:PEP-CTERM sorting domain-containing protein [Candidatus Nitrosacidococcus tergens]|uniref:Ice-binding protein C-terminal domain-containing protein n=1 Tax=Candidatus Nitrosacidococcus tergens TaxID=553981 RepID=A0A7G1Q8V2_9GAMM|nr:PEP-CTERM sorting domain-containing protein [Candidatus Nitrosacidococcus tergens]CAB1275293.1 conserved exported protein of unknown function [Candidatus Nitrosacidococcus tergens]
MKLSKISAALTLSTALAMSTHAAPINLVQNGDFSQTDLNENPVAAPTQFGTGSGNGYRASNFITDWAGNNGYEIWYPDATSATTVNATGEWTSTGKEKLWAVTPPPNGTNTFVALDGGTPSSISQQIDDLVVGQTYTLTFDWGAAQMQSRTGNTTEQLAVALSNNPLMPGISQPQVQYTAKIPNLSEGFTGWQFATMQFTANATTQTLSFLSIGTPVGLPPMAVLTNVSLTPVSHVPEPSVMMLFGAGLFGLALFTHRRTIDLL